MSEQPQVPLTPVTLPASNEVIRMSMDTVQGMEALQRAANLLSSSTLVPESYRRWTFDRDGNRVGDNPSGLANCVVALNMSTRMGADPLMIMQNMHVIEGRPSWSSVFIIASINQCGRFTPLRFDISDPGELVEVSYKYTEWERVQGKDKKQPVDKTGTMKVRHQTCRAWAIEKATGQRLDGPEVSIQMALDEGWMQKKGSKWRTMPEVMLRYRSASLFGKLYAPELLMGLQSREELEDISGEVLDATTGEMVPVRTKAKIVSAPEEPKVGDWSQGQLNEMEVLLESVTEALIKSGFKKESLKFEEKMRAKKNQVKPEELLAELRAEVAKFESGGEEPPAPSTTGALPLE